MVSFHICIYRCWFMHYFICPNLTTHALVVSFYMLFAVPDIILSIWLLASTLDIALSISGERSWMMQWYCLVGIPLVVVECSMWLEWYVLWKQFVTNFHWYSILIAFASKLLYISFLWGFWYSMLLNQQILFQDALDRETDSLIGIIGESMFLNLGFGCGFYAFLI